MRFHKSALLMFSVLLLGSGHWNNPSPRMVIGFGAASGLATANCLTAFELGNTAGGSCTTYTVVASPPVNIASPRIVDLTCQLLSAATATHDPAETVTVTPSWVKFDLAGTAATTDASISVVFDDGEDQLGDFVSNTTSSAVSPYTGPQLLRLRQDIVGAVTTGAINCFVTIQGDN